MKETRKKKSQKNLHTILKALIANLRGPREIENLYDIAHYGFSDFVFFNPWAKRREPLLGATLEGAFNTDSVAVEQGRAAIAAQRAFLRGFLRRHPG